MPTPYRSIAPALALVVWISASASAGPLLRYSWDDCDPVVPRQDFTTATTYTQTVSALALEEPVHDFNLLIRASTTGYLPPAWLFADLCENVYYSCYPGSCQPTGRASTLLAGTACDTIPGLQISAHYLFPFYGPFNVYLVVVGTADGSFVPDPGRRYTLIRIAFDHALSVAGSGAPGTCGGADDPLQFEIGESQLNGVDQRGVATWENCLLTWNREWISPQCPLIVPVRNRTWGQIKTLYR